MFAIRGSIKCFSLQSIYKFEVRALSCQSYNFNDSSNQHHKEWSKYLKHVGALGLLGTCYFLHKKRNSANLEGNVTNHATHIFSLEEIEKHKSKESGIWVTYRGKVYDITKFVDQHPGGKKILLAAGGALEPYWEIYGMHNSDAVRELLEEYFIGSLSEKDKSIATKKVLEDPYSNDPRRHPALKPASVKPYNAEPPPSLLVDNFKTPNDLFYVRNHMPVPEIDEKKFRLTIVDQNNLSKTLSLEDLKKFPKVTVTAAVQCAGNRRSEMSKAKAVKGLSWGHAAIGNADWSGARLVDVLSHLGFKPDLVSVRHVHFHGLDQGVDGVAYAASVPAGVALDPRHDVILAYEMNGEPLPRDHGAPLRAIVPGIVGARNVKWLGRVVLSQVESDSHWQQKDYKGLPPRMDFENADFSQAPAIQELPVSSAICFPEDGDTVDVDDGMITVKGYAWSGGGRKIVRVDVSADGGKTWTDAELNFGQDDVNKLDHQWGWTLWTASIPVPPGVTKVDLWAKAIDSSYNSQPESFEHIWNFRGVLSNAYHKISVNISS